MQTSRPVGHGMMSAPFASPPTADFSPRIDHALAACREACEMGSHSHFGDTLKVRLRLLCVLARQDGIPVGCLLVRLKREINASERLHDLPGHAREKTRSRAVTFLIPAYYSDRRS